MIDLSGKRVAVTGGCGFVGSHLCEYLVSLGADVYAVDNGVRGKNVPVGAKVLSIDVSHLQACSYAFRGGSAHANAQPVDYVFNLAATVAGVIHNQDHNTEMFRQNVLLQTVPVQAAEIVGVKNFLQVSSVCIYSPENNHPCLEENGHIGDPHPANGGYAWSKRVGEKVAILSSIDNVVVVRPSNIYGPRDYFDDKAHVIPALIDKALTKPSVELYGDPGNVREFIYVEDVVQGMVVAAVKGTNGIVYNLGRNGRDRLTMWTLAETIIDLAGVDKAINAPMMAGGGDLARWSDSSKAERLGWRADTDLVEGLAKTIKWRKEHAGS